MLQDCIWKEREDMVARLWTQKKHLLRRYEKTADPEKWHTCTSTIPKEWAGGLRVTIFLTLLQVNIGITGES